MAQHPNIAPSTFCPVTKERCQTNCHLFARDGENCVFYALLNSLHRLIRTVETLGER